MRYSRPFISNTFIIILLLFVFVGCDRNCNDGECPTNEKLILFEVIDSLNRSCTTINPDFEAILLSSNNLDQGEVIIARNEDFLLNIQPGITEYVLKINQTDLITLDLKAERMEVSCCGNSIEVVVEHELINRNTNDTICSNCSQFQLIIPSCD